MNLSKLLFGFFLALFSCGSSEGPLPTSGTTETQPFSSVPLSQAFKDYWYRGKAELTTFHLEQARYGEIREGLATTIFVTEDFSRSRYVKLDYPEQAGDDKVKVLKFNLNKKFVTGIYDYTLMQSVFTPVHRDQDPHTVRVTTSNIEWCGQFLTSARLRDEEYEVQYSSYFDGEEDLSVNLPVNWLEDEIWNIIRIQPEDLPIGELQMIPSILTQELIHHALKVERAVAAMSRQDSSSVYTIDYPDISRKLIIEFETAFPHRIIAWEETFPSVAGWGMESKLLTTKARRVKYTLSDYWEKKFLKDEPLRQEALGLPAETTFQMLKDSVR